MFSRGTGSKSSIDPELPMLRLDPILFEQVLFNLLDNAAKYAPEGSRIDLRARRDGDAVAIEVIDEGPGIPPGDLERVFDKFYRVQAQDRRRAGTGLGSGDLPRLYRGAGRAYRGAEPAGPFGYDLDGPHPGAGIEGERRGQEADAE